MNFLKVLMVFAGIVFGSAASATVVKEPWGDREVFDTGLSLELPKSYKLVRRASRSIIAESTNGDWRVDVNIIPQAKKLPEAVRSIIENGKKSGWEILSWDFYKNANSSIFARIEVRMKAKGGWYISWFQLANWDGMTVMLNATSHESKYDAEHAMRIMDGVSYHENVMDYKPFEGSIEDLAKGSEK